MGKPITKKDIASKNFIFVRKDNINDLIKFDPGFKKGINLMSYLNISGKRYHIGLATDFFDKGYHRVYINKFLFGMRVKNPTFEQSKKILKKYIARGLMEFSDEQSIGETINLHSEKKYY